MCKFLEDVLQIIRSGLGVGGVDSADVGTADFPTLKIIASGMHDFMTLTGVETVYTHGVGSYLAFAVWNTDGSFNGDALAFRMSTTALSIDTDRWPGDDGTTSLSMSVYYEIYAVDVFATVEYTSVNSGTDFTPGSDINSVYAVSQQDMNIAEMSAFTTALDNQYRGFLVHSVINKVNTWTGSWSTPLFTQAHGLTYPPSYLAYIKTAANSYMIQIYSDELPAFYMTSTNIVAFPYGGITWAETFTMAFVILKDPVMLAK